MLESLFDADSVVSKGYWKGIAAGRLGTTRIFFAEPRERFCVMSRKQTKEEQQQEPSFQIRPAFDK